MWSHNQIVPGAAFKLAFMPVIADGYHVYGHGEDEMSPFRVEFEFPRGLTLRKPPRYPDAHKYHDPILDMDLESYEEDIPMAAFELRASDDLKPGEIKVNVILSFQACNDTLCFPPSTKRFTLPLTVAPTGSRMRPVGGGLMRGQKESWF